MHRLAAAEAGAQQEGGDKARQLVDILNGVDPRVSAVAVRAADDVRFLHGLRVRLLVGDGQRLGAQTPGAYLRQHHRVLVQVGAYGVVRAQGLAGHGQTVQHQPFRPLNGDAAVHRRQALGLLVLLHVLLGVHHVDEDHGAHALLQEVDLHCLAQGVVRPIVAVAQLRPGLGEVPAYNGLVDVLPAAGNHMYRRRAHINKGVLRSLSPGNHLRLDPPINAMQIFCHFQFTSFKKHQRACQKASQSLPPAGGK